MTLFFGLHVSHPASCMLYVQYLEKTKSVWPPHLHTPCFLCLKHPSCLTPAPVHPSPTSGNISTSTKPSQPPAAKLGTIPIVTDMSRGTSCCRNRCLPQPYYKPLVGWYHIYSFLYCQSLELKCNSVYLRNNTQSSDAAIAIIIIFKQLLKEGKEWSLSWMA